jgi:predicted ATPase
MYFVEKDAEGTRFRDVAVNRYGAILDWPREFFDQSQREAERILKAGIEKKRREREAAQASKKEGENG